MHRAFTLVEILIVMAIIFILVTLTMPNIVRSRIIANEGAALAHLKSISKSCQLYYINYTNYPENLSILTQTTPPYLDDILASGSRDGYSFIYGTTSSGFTLNANPEGILKGRYFYLDQTEVIHVNNDSEAGPGDEIFK